MENTERRFAPIEGATGRLYGKYDIKRRNRQRHIELDALVSSGKRSGKLLSRYGNKYADCFTRWRGFFPTYLYRGIPDHLPENKRQQNERICAFLIVLNSTLASGS